MGPNGSGKSTLAYSIAGHPKYTVTSGSVTLDGEDVLAMTVDERARAGLFLAMQYPVEVPGVSVVQLPAYGEDRPRRRGAQAAHLGQGRQRRARAARPRPDVRPARSTRASPAARRSATRSLQLELLNPKVAVLDETDSGLDIDALKVVAEGVNRFRAQEGKGVLLITHYTRILRYIEPDFVHVFVAGRIAEQGGPELADQLEAEGYDKYVKAATLVGA